MNSFSYSFKFSRYWFKTSYIPCSSNEHGLPWRELCCCLLWRHKHLPRQLQVQQVLIEDMIHFLFFKRTWQKLNVLCCCFILTSLNTYRASFIWIQAVVLEYENLFQRLNSELHLLQVVHIWFTLITVNPGRCRGEGPHCLFECLCK